MSESDHGRSPTAPGYESVPDRPGEAVTLAWLAIGLWGALATAAMLWVAPAAADLIAPEPLDFFADPLSSQGLIRPEHTELVRVGFALLAAIAVAVTVAYGSRDLVAGRLARFASPLARIGPFAVLAVVLLAWLNRSEPFADVRNPDYFSTLAGIGALAAAVAVVAVAGRSTGSPPSGVRAIVDALGRRGVAAAVAVIATVCFVAPGVFTDASLPDARTFIVPGHLPGIFADFAAVANGATPGVDFASQYATLLPYALAPILAVTDYSPGGFTIIASLLTCVALLALWRALALATRNEAAGIALYLPVLAVSLIPLEVFGDERLANNSQYQILPERYLLPCLLAWLVVRRLRGAAPRRDWILFLLAGLAAINNPEFGLPCLLATFGGLAIARRDRGSPTDEVRRLLGAAAIGVGAATVAACAVTLVAAGALPDPGVVLYYSRLFGSQGFGLLPMPTVGFHLIVFATCAGALTVAAIRARAGAADRALTGILAYAGLFGTLAGFYYAGRSNSYSLNGLFPAWGFALALLAWIVWNRIRAAAGQSARAFRAAGPLGVAVLAGFGLAASTIFQVASPWSQVSRIADQSELGSWFDFTKQERFMARYTSPDEPIVYLGKNGFLIGRDVGFRNVTLVSDPIHVVSAEQMDEIIDRLREAGGSAVFTSEHDLPPLHQEILDYLRDHGFQPVAEDPDLGLTRWRPEGSA